MDKTLILNRVKAAHKLGGNTDLARFLGVAPNTITNWYNRNSVDYDLIFSKCENVNLEWLITGKGKMLKTSNIGNVTAGDNSPIYSDIQQSNVAGNNVNGNNNQISVGEDNTLIGGNANGSTISSVKKPQSRQPTQSVERSMNGVITHAEMWEVVKAQQQTIAAQQQTIAAQQQTIDFLTQRNAKQKIQ